MGLTLEILGSLGQKGLASNLGVLGSSRSSCLCQCSPSMPGSQTLLGPSSAFSSTDSRLFLEGRFFNLLASSNKID